MAIVPRIKFAQQRLGVLGDQCTILPHRTSDRQSSTVPCMVMTPSLKLGHGYGHEGGGPTILSRRVTKTIVVNNDVTIESGDKILWVDKGITFIAGQPTIPSTLDPYIMIMSTQES